MTFKSGDKVEFVAGNGKAYKGTFVRTFYPGSQSMAGPHYRIQIGGGVVATIFANGPVGKSVKKVSA